MNLNTLPYSCHIYNKTSMVGIYKITNPQGKVYIGQSVDIESRWASYKRLNCKNQTKLYNSLKKYNPENHLFEKIEECSMGKLDEREEYWGLYYNSLKEGLNLKLGKGRGLVSEETKKRMRKSHLDKKVSQTTKDKISKSKTNHPMYNQEWKDKISESLKGRYTSPTTRTKMSKSKLGRPSTFKGKKHSEETKLKMSEYRKQKYLNTHKTKPVLQYDLNMNLIKEWSSVISIKREIKGDIAACCRGKQKTAGGFIFKYK